MDLLSPILILKKNCQNASNVCNILCQGSPFRHFFFDVFDFRKTPPNFEKSPPGWRTLKRLRKNRIAHNIKIHGWYREKCARCSEKLWMDQRCQILPLLIFRRNFHFCQFLREKRVDMLVKKSWLFFFYLNFFCYWWVSQFIPKSSKFEGN